MASDLIDIPIDIDASIAMANSALVAGFVPGPLGAAAGPGPMNGGIFYYLFIIIQ